MRLALLSQGDNIAQSPKLIIIYGSGDVPLNNAASRVNEVGTPPTPPFNVNENTYCEVNTQNTKKKTNPLHLSLS